jgi:hypothetical protein
MGRAEHTLLGMGAAMGALPESGRPSPYWWATLCSGSASTAGPPVEQREPERGKKDEV